MKKVFTIAFIIISALYLKAEDKPAQADENINKEKTADSGITEERLSKIKDLPLTAKEIMGFVQTATVKDLSFNFDASISVSLPRDSKEKQKAIEKYTKNGKVPFKIYSSVHQSQPGKKSTLYTKGKASIWMIDKDNNVVFKKNESLGKLCAS